MKGSALPEFIKVTSVSRTSYSGAPALLLDLKFIISSNTYQIIILGGEKESGYFTPMAYIVRFPNGDEDNLSDLTAFQKTMFLGAVDEYNKQFVVRSSERSEQLGGNSQFSFELNGKMYVALSPLMYADNTIHDCDYLLVTTDKLNYDVVDSPDAVVILQKYNSLQNGSFKFDFSGNVEQKNMNLFDSLFQYLSTVGSRGRVCVFTNMPDRQYVNARFVNRVTNNVVVPQSGKYTDPGNFIGQNLTYEKDANGKIIGSHSDWTFEYDYQLDKDGRIVADNTKPNKAGFEDLIYTKFVK